MSGPRPLQVLHLLANFKWTGPADPAIRCAVRLRAAGAEVVFAEAQWTLPGAEHRMRTELQRSGLQRTTDLELRKHFHLSSVLRDARRLAARLRRGELDVLHCHLAADHLVAALARRWAGGRVRLVRSLYEPEPPPRRWRPRLAFGVTDGVVVPTAGCGEQLVRRYGLDPARVLVQEPPTEPRPLRPELDDLRAELDLERHHLVVGITARIQPHRRFELLWRAARRVVDARPEARFVLLGRGNERDTRRLVHEPIATLGLRDHVLLPGYLHEPEYERALRGLDVFLFLVPGSDGTCRAVREAMALGKPVVATARGMLPDLVGRGEDACGLVCEETEGGLAGGLSKLLGDAALRRRLGAASAAKAAGAMDPERAAARLLAFYQRLGAP